jgi:hypothetical protein
MTQKVGLNIREDEEYRVRYAVLSEKSHGSVIQSHQFCLSLRDTLNWPGGHLRRQKKPILGR